MKAAPLAGGLMAVMLLFAAAQCAARFGLSGGGGGVIALETAEPLLEDVLNNIAFTSPSSGYNEAVLYQISFRTCPPCIQSHDNILPKLQAAGLDTRLVTTARKGRSTEKERAAVVENARRKDWAFTQEWWAGRNPNRFYAETELPAVDGDAQREAELRQLQNHVYELANVLAANGAKFAFPTLIWKTQAGDYKAAIGYNPSLTTQILSDIRGG